MIGVLLVDAGLTILLIGAVSLVRPLRRLGIRNRKIAALWLSAGLGVLMAGLLLLPAPLERVSQRRMLLDELLPAFQFSEHHEVRVHAPRERVFEAVREVTAREIRFFRLLTWIRAPRLSKAQESILAPPADRPILEVALRSGFSLLGEQPPREIVFGTFLGRRSIRALSPQAFATLDPPGVSKVAMNFRIEEEDNGWCRLTTETRVFSTDESARRAFAPYWRIIYPGSSVIRHMWLAAVRRRAERVADPGKPSRSGVS